jgi:hypothetical protein
MPRHTQGAPGHNNQQGSLFVTIFLKKFQGSFLSSSTVSTSTTSSNMDNALGMASSANNNTEDALADSSPPGAQADDDHVHIVGSTQAIEERTFLKHKSNDGDDQQNKQKKQRKRPAISSKQQKRPAISDTDLEKQVNWVRDVSLQNVVDSSLQATQSLDFDNNDGATKVIN